jgi:glycosyltransferase involved in cell wall biosynthesis
MRIIIYSYTFWPPDFGGELLVSIERAEELSKRGYQVTFLTSGHRGVPSFSVEKGVEIYRSHMIHERWSRGILRRGSFILWALRRLLAMDFDVLHIGSLPGIGKISDSIIGKLMALVAHSKKARCITVMSLAEKEETPIDFQSMAGKIYRSFLLCMDNIVGVSVTLYETIQRYFPGKPVLIPYGIRDDIFLPLSAVRWAQVREEAGAKTNDIIFIFLGSVGTRKGFDLLAQAFAELSPGHPEWRLWVIGPNTKEQSQNIVVEEVNCVTQPLKGNDRVTFWGRIDDRQRLAEVLAAGDVFVFPTRREGMPIAPMEAMAAGLPVIIARIPGVTDMVNIHGETGYYITPGNLDELKKAMAKLGMDKILRERMGRKARARVIESFGWKKHIDQWESLYKSLKE